MKKDAVVDGEINRKRTKKDLNCEVENKVKKLDK
jgi:hypothetical protein